MKLSEIQTAFSRFLRGKADFPLNEIEPAGTLDADGAVRVYKTAYSARLTEALGETYETIWRVLGDDDFFDICRNFIASHDSVSPNLSDYGREFGSFCAHAFPDFPFLEDLGAFEWEWKNAFHAPDKALRPSDLGRDPDSLVLDFVPSFRLFWSRFAILTLWEHRTDEDEDGSGLAWETPETFYVVRSNFTMRSHRITPDEYSLLSDLWAGKTLGIAVDQTSLSEVEVAGLFKRLVESGAIAGALNPG